MALNNRYSPRVSLHLEYAVVDNMRYQLVAVRRRDWREVEGDEHAHAVVVFLYDFLAVLARHCGKKWERGERDRDGRLDASARELLSGDGFCNSILHESGDAREGLELVGHVGRKKVCNGCLPWELVDVGTRLKQAASRDIIVRLRRCA